MFQTLSEKQFNSTKVNYKESLQGIGLEDNISGDNEILQELTKRTIAKRREKVGAKRGNHWKESKANFATAYMMVNINGIYFPIYSDAFQSNPDKPPEPKQGELNAETEMNHGERRALVDVINKAIQAGWEPEDETGRALPEIDSAIPPFEKELEKFKHALKDLKVVIYSEIVPCEKDIKHNKSCANLFNDILSDQNHQIYYSNTTNSHKDLEAKESLYDALNHFESLISPLNKPKVFTWSIQTKQMGTEEAELLVESLKASGVHPSFITTVNEKNLSYIKILTSDLEEIKNIRDILGTQINLVKEIKSPMVEQEKGLDKQPSTTSEPLIFMGPFHIVKPKIMSIPSETKSVPIAWEEAKKLGRELESAGIKGHLIQTIFDEDSNLYQVSVQSNNQKYLDIAKGLMEEKGILALDGKDKPSFRF